MSVHTIQQNQQQNNRLHNPVLESMSSAVMTGANNAIARAVLTGMFKAIDGLTRDQDNFLNSLGRKKEVEKGYGSFSEVVAATPLAAFCEAFPSFNTPGALEIVKGASMGKDYTIYAISDGTVQFKIARGKKIIEVV